METPTFITEENVSRVDPMVPTSMGALLAEEWSIDPYSPLPSFLEITMMDEARRSGQQSLKWIFAQLEQRLLRMAAASNTNEDASPSASTTTTTTNFWWRRLQSKLATFVVRKILEPFGPEIRFLIACFLERRSLLSNSSATISEALYGGKRVKLGLQEDIGTASSNNTGAGVDAGTAVGGNQRRLLPMSKQDGIRLAFLLSFGPYLAERCDKIYRNIHLPNAVISQKMRKIFKIIYPFLHMSIQGIHLLERWRYLLGQSFFADGYSRYLNLVVRRVTMEDQEPTAINPSTESSSSDANDNNHHDNQNYNKSNNSNPVRKLADADTMTAALLHTKMTRVALAVFSSAIALGWLARIRAAQEEMDQQRRTQQLQYQEKDSIPPHPPPIPPRVPSMANNNYSNISSKLCPLCRQPRINPAASTGGYVFCLKCILPHVRMDPKCPVTGKTCLESLVVQLFEPNLP